MYAASLTSVVKFLNSRVDQWLIERILRVYISFPRRRVK